MILTMDERDLYVIAQMDAHDKTLVYSHYQQYGAKFGIYYNVSDGTLTAKFCSITGLNRDWRTDNKSFKALVNEVVERM